MIDDSQLFHGTYDPVKAREYYLRNRKLKGRRPTTATVTAPGKGGRRPSSPTIRPGGTPNRSKTKSRQAELRAQKEALKKRVDRLQDVLAELVEAAKKRSGGDPNKSKKDAKDTAPETAVDKADRNKAEKDSKSLTSKQKADKAQAAKEAYEKENPNTLSTDIDILQAQVKDIQAKIQKAMSDAQARRKTAGESKTKSGSNTNRSGPQGR